MTHRSAVGSVATIQLPLYTLLVVGVWTVTHPRHAQAHKRTPAATSVAQPVDADTAPRARRAPIRTPIMHCAAAQA
jgi:hypothetical protein